MKIDYMGMRISSGLMCCANSSSDRIGGNMCFFKTTRSHQCSPDLSNYIAL